MSAYPLHPAAELFPPMDAESFAALQADIAENGQHAPILLFEGQVIDGRHRLMACQRLGMTPKVCELDSALDPTAVVVSFNLHRRHLNESQRSMVAARIANKRQGERTDLEPSANLQKVSQAEAATLLGVSPRSVAAAVNVQKVGTPELIAAVDQGELAVSTAADLARLPANSQRDVLAKTPEELRAIARQTKARIAEAGVCGPSAVKLFDDIAAEQDLSGIEQIAVVEAMKADDPPLPTPAEAKRIASQGAPGLLVMGSDGRYHSAPADPDEEAAMERWMCLREGLESLATLPFGPHDALAAIPAYQHSNVRAWLAQAVPFLNQLNDLWRQNHA